MRSPSSARRGIIECNGVTAFIARNWIDILQSVGIIAGLLTSAYTIRKEGEVRRIQNLFTLTKSHREIWSQVVEKPELARVLSEKPDLDRDPITHAEHLFVLFLILHLASSFEARKQGMYFAEHGLSADAGEFFKLPIPRAVWRQVRKYQAPEFTRFVERCLNGPP